MRARRSSLSVPGSSEKMLAKAGGLQADEIVVDLEDSVSPAAKPGARELVTRLLAEGVPEGGAVALRVNALDSPWWRDDVAAVGGQAGARIDSVVVPKVERAEHVESVDRLLETLGGDASGIRLQALVETAAGLQRAGEIAAASPRLDSLILGYADLAASLGKPPGSDVPEHWLHAQQTVLLAARAAGLQAIDGPYLAIRDETGLRARAEHVRALGFDGKWAVHPDQVPIINEVFTPSRDEFERARAIVAALDSAAGAEGRGALELNGEMIDEASRKLAIQTVARGEAAGLEASG